MASSDGVSRGVPVPSGRLARIGRIGSLATGVAGTMAVNGARDLLQGRRPDFQGLLLTPANATRFAESLAQMRGAAMKVGQLISMEAGDVLPPELAEILARLRADAHAMPPKQLKTVLTAAWGPDFTRRFKRFDPRPIAAASIGQVHKAETREGRVLAIKVQYPGVKESIDSDVTNVGALIRMAGLIPKGIDIAPMLEEAKAQLHDEADYAREGAQLARFGAFLAETSGVRVPALCEAFTTDRVLAMDFEPSVAIDDLSDAPQDDRDRLVTALFDLLLRELFEFGAMQTDPNFANYRYDRESGEIVLLDFGAARDVPAWLSRHCMILLQAGLARSDTQMEDAAAQIGLFAPNADAGYRAAVMAMVEMAMEPMRYSGPYDFGASSLPQRMREAGMAFSGMRGEMHIPPMDVLYVQRKVGGMFLLASRLRARVDMPALLAPWLRSAQSA